MKTYRYIFISKVTNATRVHMDQITRINPNVMIENNMLWIKMQQELSDDIKIKLEGSLYNFYFAMHKFLINHNNYLEAHKFSLNQVKKYLKLEYKNVDKLIKKYSLEKIYICLFIICLRLEVNLSSILIEIFNRRYWN